MLEVKLFNDEFLKQFENAEGELKKALRLAKDRALSSAKTEVIRRIPKFYDVKQKTLREKSVFTKREDGMMIKGSPIRLFKFKVSPKDPPSTSFIRVSVKKNTKIMTKAFVQRMRSNGMVGVFERVGKKKYPIEQLYSVSVPQMAEEENVLDGAMERAKLVFDERLEHEMGRLEI